MYIPPEIFNEDSEINKFVNGLNINKTWNTKNLDDHYILNKEEYNADINIYGQVNPECILQTAIVLPFYLPIEDNYFTIPFYAFNKYGRCTISLFFSAIQDKKVFTGGFIQKKGIQYKRKTTRVEINILFIEDFFIKDGRINLSVLDIAKFVQESVKKGGKQTREFINAVQDMFLIRKAVVSSAIILINSFIISYSKKSNNDAMHCIEMDNIEHISHFRVIEPKEWITYNWMSINNTHFIKEQKPANDEELVEMFLEVNISHGNYFELHYNYYLKGRNALQNGDNLECIIFLVMSIEVLVTKILSLYYLFYNNKNEKEVKEKVQSLSFKNMLNRELPNILGGNWNLENGGSIPGKWFNTVYVLRGRIVHGGYSPNRKEMTESINNTNIFLEYINKSMQNKKKKLEKIINNFSTPFK